MNDRDELEEKIVPNGPKTAFFKVTEKFGHQYFLHLIYNEIT